MKLYFCDMQKEKDNIEAFFHTLSEKDKREFSALHHLRRIEKTAGLMLLSRVFKEEGIFDFELKRNEYGKPYAEGDLHFNISHSDNILVLVTDSSPVGVDVERIREIDLNVTRKFATESEREYIFAGETDLEKYRRFFTVWTLKEAYIKAEGEGMHIPLKSIGFTVSDTLAVTSTNGKWHFETRMTEENYVCSVAVRKERENA